MNMLTYLQPYTCMKISRFSFNYDNDYILGDRRKLSPIGVDLAGDHHKGRLEDCQGMSNFKPIYQMLKLL